MLTDNTRKRRLLSWQIQNEIIEIFAHDILRELIKHIDGVIIVCCSNYNGIDLDANNG